MFKVLIAKQCNNHSCPLVGQMQDKGLPICPECASELKPIVRTNQRLLALTILCVGLLFSGFGSIAYGMLVKSLAPVDTLKWLAGRAKLQPSLGAPEFASLFEGILYIQSARPEANLRDDRLFCEVREGIRWCRERNLIKAGDEAWFNLTPHVDHLYVFYRGPGKAAVIFPSDPQTTVFPGKALELPHNQRMRISGSPDTESFLIVASRQPVPSLVSLASGKAPLTPADLDAAAKPLANSPDVLVLYVEIPHS